MNSQLPNFALNIKGMKIGLIANKLLLLLFTVIVGHSGSAQFLVEQLDSSDKSDKGLWAVYNKTDHLQISGYFQPQFQFAQSKGVKNFSGGDFAANSDNRFMIRRGRIRFDYAHFNKDGLPQAQVVFQFDGSEKGVSIRDFFARYYENKWQLFTFTAGMFARPFGYELNLSSSDRGAISFSRDGSRVFFACAPPRALRNTEDSANTDTDSL